MSTIYISNNGRADPDQLPHHLLSTFTAPIPVENDQPRVENSKSSGSGVLTEPSASTPATEEYTEKVGTTTTVPFITSCLADLGLGSREG